MSSNNPPLVPGTYRSIRAFGLTSSGALTPLVTQRKPLYVVGGVWYKATCAVEGRHYSYMRRPGGAAEISVYRHDPDTLDPLCVCGFYSVRSDTEAIALAIERIDHPTTEKGWGSAVGVVDNAGRVFHHSDGLRSEYMRVMGIYPIEGDSQSIQSLYERFAVFNRMSDMLEALPLSPAPEGVTNHAA